MKCSTCNPCTLKIITTLRLIVKDFGKLGKLGEEDGNTLSSGNLSVLVTAFFCLEEGLFFRSQFIFLKDN